MKYSKLIALSSGLSAIIIITSALILIHGGYKINLIEDNFFIRTIEIYLGIFSIPILFKMIWKEYGKL